jgi:NAD(P)-dependent dehydrogenase (short-subunit alcohol dehydrogenase family)
VLVRIDYSDFSSAAIAAAQCAGIFGKLDVLVNCAAVNVAPNAGPEASKGPLERLAPEALMMMFATNVAGPVVTCQAFLPLLRKARRPLVVNISTTRASLALATDSRSFGYAVTKAALNMATRKIAAELRALDGVAVAVDPGWLRTRMGGQAAPTGPDEAAARLLRTVLSEENMANGRFLTAEGKDLPW